MFVFPDYIKTVLEVLEESGFEAYIVGGCVRDFFLNRKPNDFDIATNALPNEVKRCFNGFKFITSGEKHGTITVLLNGNQTEITTYRIDGKYIDNRHPGSVCFSSKLSKDLERRDFTINAIAMNSCTEVYDLFNGLKDLKDKVIRTVGSAEKRFNEDALRILRALRFASQLNFSIERETSLAIHKYAHLIKNISSERIREEFVKILTGKNTEEILRDYRDVIAVFIPEIKASFEFDQHSPYHKYDVWEHTTHAVSVSKTSKNIRLTMFFHDIAKPSCFKQDQSGRGHFKGHAAKGAEITYEIMKRLKFCNKDVENITCLIKHHSDKLNNKAEIKILMNRIGTELLLELLNVQRADSMSKHDFCLKRLKIVDEQEKIIKSIIDNNECFRLKDMEINGNDLKKLGIEGSQTGIILKRVLNEIIHEKIKNDKKTIINYILLIK